MAFTPIKQPAVHRRVRRRGQLIPIPGSVEPNPIQVVEGGTAPKPYSYTEGDTLESNPDYTEITSPANYESSEGTITDVEWTVDGVPRDNTYVLSEGERVVLAVSDSVGNIRRWTIDQSVAGIPPELAASVILVIGQSNATDYAQWDAGEDWVSNTQQWGRNGEDNNTLTPADASGIVRPLQHFSQPGQIGYPLTYVADYRAANPNQRVIVVPSAQGATKIGPGETWWPGGERYDDAVARCNAAMAAAPGSTLDYILWMQGASNNGDTFVEYATKQDQLIKFFRTDLIGADSTTPWACGGFAEGTLDRGVTIDQIYAAIIDTPNRVPYTAFVDVFDLATADPDPDHFTAASFREIGHRYYTAKTVAETNVAIPASIDTQPTIDNTTPNVGDLLTVTPGNVSGFEAPDVTYQWRADSVDISGETGTTYLTVAGDEGKRISVRQTATNDAGSDSLESALTAAVGPAAGFPTTALVFSVIPTTTTPAFDLGLDAADTYNFTVDWGDGTQDTIQSGSDTAQAHDYTTAGLDVEYDIVITGILGRMSPYALNGNNSANANLITQIKQLGSAMTGSQFAAFRFAASMTSVNLTPCDLSAITEMNSFFANCSGLTSFTGAEGLATTTSVTTFQSFMLGAAHDVIDPSDIDFTSQAGPTGPTGLFNFAAGSKIATADYHNTLINWNAQWEDGSQSGARSPNFGSSTTDPGAGGDAARAAKTNLENVHGWTITDGDP